MMGGVSRREVLRQLALAATGASTGAFNLEAARVVHTLAGEGRAQPGGYAPQALTMREFRTVTRLAELIIPADASGGSGVDAGAPEFIDLLCSQNAELADIFTGGLAWLDAAMGRRESATFVDTPPDRQTAMLDELVASERDGRARDMAPGVNFFSWIRRLTVDAYYTSPIGIRDVGYRGNASLRAYETPAAALEHINRVADDLGL